MGDVLFEIAPTPVLGPAPKPSADRRRTQRQAETLALGVHPLTNALGTTIKLHAKAAPADDRKAAGLRCGDCWFRELTVGWGSARSYPKCSFGAPEVGHWPRFSRGAGTDVRAWWPACVDFKAVDRA